MWRKNYGKKERKDKANSRYDDYQMLITPNQVQMYLEGDNVKSVNILVKNLNEDIDYGISQTNYCSIRDHLFVLILFSNACRSGVPAGMLVTEFNSAEIKSDDSYCIKVKDHKTDYLYGPFLLILKPDVYNLLHFFVNKVRDLVNPAAPQVLLSCNGNRMTGIFSYLYILYNYIIIKKNVFYISIL